MDAAPRDLGVSFMVSIESYVVILSDWYAVCIQVWQSMSIVIVLELQHFCLEDVADRGPPWHCLCLPYIFT
jgi:hypothetical protein